MAPRAWLGNSYLKIEVDSFVICNSSANYVAGIRGVGVGRNRRMNSSQSREETISNGNIIRSFNGVARKRFQDVATALKGLSEYHVDRAVQCYKLALMHNFTQGRKQGHVVAACLYIVCRQEKTTRMCALTTFTHFRHAD